MDMIHKAVILHRRADQNYARRQSGARAGLSFIIARCISRDANAMARPADLTAFISPLFPCRRLQTPFRGIEVRATSPLSRPRYRVARLHSPISTRCIAEQTDHGDGRHAPLVRQKAGGSGPLSAEFLAVSGVIATSIGVVLTLPLLYCVKSFPIVQNDLSKGIYTALSSFAYGLILSRFDLGKAKSLRLTIVFSLLMRFICMPVLSHAVATAGYALFSLSGTKTAAAAAAAAVKAPQTVKATAASLSLPAGVLSSLFLLSTTPAGFSPCAAMLSLHLHTTLLAILTALTIACFPILPSISHGVSIWAHRSAFLNIGNILPQVASPPSFFTLLHITTVPFLLGMGLNQILPRRLAAAGALVSLPVSWLCSLLLLASAMHQVVVGSITGLAGSVGLCAGVAVMMFLLARALGSALLLDERAKRTLTVYLCTQGTTIGVGVAPGSFAAAPHVASALVGLIFAALMAQLWSHVIIKTSTDIIL